MKTNRFLLAACVSLAMVFTFSACSSDSDNPDELVQANRATKNGNSGRMGDYNWRYSCNKAGSWINDTLYINGGNLYSLSRWYKEPLGNLLDDLFFRNKEVSVNSLCKCLKVSNFNDSYDYDCASFEPQNPIVDNLVEGNSFLIKSGNSYQFFRITRFAKFDSCPSYTDLEISYATFECN